MGTAIRLISTCALLLSSTVAAAQEPADFLQLSFTGDGTTPSAMSVFEDQREGLAAPRYAVNESARGDASYSIPIELPPALVQPTLALVYSSAGGTHSHISRGWSIDAGMRITRISGNEGSHAYAEYMRSDGVSEAFRVSGGGLDGIVVPDGAEWAYASTEGIAASFQLDELTQTWTVRADGLTTTLQANADIDIDDPGVWVGAWHTTQVVDELGNGFVQEWEGSRLSAIRLGGWGAQGLTGFLADVELSYQQPAPSSFQAQGGFVERIDDRLSSIRVVPTAAAPGVPAALSEWSLGYTDVDGEPAFSTLDQVSVATGASRQVVELEYAEWEVDDDAPLVVGAEPPFLSATFSGTVDASLPSLNTTGQGLYDASGDGIADAWDVFDVSWQVWTDVPSGFPYVRGVLSTWDAPIALNDDIPTYSQLAESQSARCGPDASKQFHMRRLIDVDGDGFQDLIETSAPPMTPWSYGLDFCGDTQEVQSTSWSIAFGTPGGFESYTSTTAPVQFPGVTRPALSKKQLGDDLAIYEDASGGLIELMDLDGDGWQDIVRVEYHPSQPAARLLVAYYHSGFRGGGWDVGVPVAEGFDLPGLEALETTRMWSNIEAVSPWYAQTGGSASTYVSVPVAETSSIKGFHDVNGDGLVDWVDSSGWTTALPFWDVSFGTGARGLGAFRTSEHAWPSPVPHFSLVDEGAAKVTSCSYTDPGFTIDSEQVHVGNEETGFGFNVGGLGLYIAWKSFDGATNPLDAKSFALDGTNFNCSVPTVAGGPQGRHSRVVTRLLDMDGDGRLDLVRVAPKTEPNKLLIDPLQGTGSPEWYRNTGAGFDPNPLPVPAWFGSSLDSSLSYQVVFTHDDNILGPTPPDESQVVSSRTSRVGLTSVVDLDRDGALDKVYVDNPYVDGDTVGVIYGTRSLTPSALGESRPGLLVQVRTGFGAETELAYASSATFAPSGSGGVHQMNAHRDVLVAVETVDPVTGHAARKGLMWQDGLCEGGACLGFQTTGVVNEIHDPAIHAAGEFQQMSYTTGLHWLQRDHQLPLQSRVFQDDTHPWPDASAPSTGPSWFQVRETNWTYQAAPVTATLDTHWGDARTEWERALGGTDDREWMVWNERDAFGNITVQEHNQLCNGSPCTDFRQELRVEVEYASNADATLFVPSQVGTHHQKRYNGPWVLDEAARFEYDSLPLGSATAGKLTEQVLSSTLGTMTLWADTELWTFTRTPRGAVDTVTAPGNRSQTFTHTYGDAVVLTAANGLGHVTESIVDQLGREVGSVDPNGVRDEQTLDAYGRPLEEVLVSADGIAHDVRSWQYVDAVGASWVEETRRTFHDDEGSLVQQQAVAFQSLDGFGDVVQTWEPSEFPGEWVVTETLTDIAGNPVRQGYPHRESAFFPALATISPDIAAYHLRDAFGRPRISWEDHSAGLGRTELDYGAGTIDVLDADGFERTETYDTRNRLIRVDEGRNGVSRRTATYRYDARSRLTYFKDASQNVYEYNFDGLGRMREVRRKAQGEPKKLWFSFDYDGPDPIEMWEGASGSGTLAATWTYDVLGRPVQKDVLDATGTGSDTYTWEWDGTWIGKRSRVTDPSGETVYLHGVSGVLGNLGHERNLQRNWSDGVAVQWRQEFDTAGNKLQSEWTDGTVVRSSFHSNGWPHQASVDAAFSGDSALVTYTYDNFGLPSGWSGSVAGDTVSQQIFHDTPTRTADILWTRPDSTVQAVGYTWLDNGMLDTRALPDVGGELQVDYDAWKRVTSLHEPVLGQVFETFAYDEIGNLTDHFDGSTTWTYADAEFSQVPARNGSNGDSQDLMWDAVGRLQHAVDLGSGAQAEVFAYDGASRLKQRDLTIGSTLTTSTYAYDVDDGLVMETHTGDHARTVYRFGGERVIVPENGAVLVDGPQLISSVLPMLSVADGDFRWRFVEPDGHALETLSADGTTQSVEVAGSYGKRISSLSSGTWPVDGFHGSDPDSGLSHMGARHMRTGDGLWMQPEPLLYLGMTNGDLRRPLGYGGVYAAGSPWALEDRSGRTANEWFAGSARSFNAAATSLSKGNAGDGAVGLLHGAAGMLQGAVGAVSFFSESTTGYGIPGPSGPSSPSQPGQSAPTGPPSTGGSQAGVFGSWTDTGLAYEDYTSNGTPITVHGGKRMERRGFTGADVDRILGADPEGTWSDDDDGHQKLSHLATRN